MVASIRSDNDLIAFGYVYAYIIKFYNKIPVRRNVWIKRKVHVLYWSLVNNMNLEYEARKRDENQMNNNDQCKR